MTISDERGATGQFMVFTSGNSDKIIIGNMLDLSSDPWGRTSMEPLHLKDRPTLGPDNAPVTIIEFADFECPYCAHAMGTVENAVQNKYHGQVQLIFKNFPLPGHEWAQGAAAAAECVRLQNPAAFWDFAQEFYRDQASITPENLRAKVDHFAAQHSLDTDTLHSCMLSKQPERRIAEDVADGQKVNVASTPALFVNGIPLLGDPEPATLDFVIDSELSKRPTAAR